MRGVFLGMALLVPFHLPAQLVRGRVLEEGGAPIARALVELRRPSGEVANRGVTGPGGAFAINASSPGSYTLRVAAIGYAPNRSVVFAVPSAGIEYGDVRLSRIAVTLAELEVLGTARCGQQGGGSEVLARLLESARTSLDVMQGSIGSGGNGFRVQLVHRTALATRRDSVVTADTVNAALLRWPIESLDPDSIRDYGFMMQVRDLDMMTMRWFGPDVRVLFAEWFLESHCFRVRPRGADTTEIVVEFEPTTRGNRVDIAGTLVLNPATFALQRLTFEHRNLPRTFRAGIAGGQISFEELPSGTWLPTAWRIFAPIRGGAGQPVGIDERAGRVLAAEDPSAPGEVRRRVLDFRVPRELLVPPDSLTDVAHYMSALDAACPHPAPRDRMVLLGDAARLQAAAGGTSPTAQDWHALACVRGLLDAVNAPAREGLRMPLGGGWQEGATNAWLEALEIDNTHLGAVEGLAVLALDQARPKRGADVRTALARAVHNGTTAPAAVRACALYALRESELERSNRCVVEGLRDGGDSTWQLLQLARLAARGADTLMVTTLFEAALKSAHDSAAWREVGWHLHWFTEPGEWQAWQSLPDPARPAWVRDRLASRDVRDGRRPGARLVEHFRRLDHAEVAFLRDRSRRFRGYTALPATNDKGGRPVDPDAVRLTSQPETVPALPFRDYVPSVEWMDDRGAVYLRFGEPTKSVIWYDTSTGSGMVREAWLYEVDAGRMLVNFESESFDGSAEATRLVTGVLGQYLCHLDTPRCQLTNRLICFELPPQPGCDRNDRTSPLSRERLETLRTEDRSDIAIATTRDDNGPRTAHAIRTVAQFSRVWDPRSGAPLAVIPYAFKLGDVERVTDSSGVTATLELALRQWSAASGTWSSTDFPRRLRFTGRLRDDAYLTGFSVVPSALDVSAWSLVASQGADRSGRAWGDRLTPLPSGALAMSDLVLGAESQGQTWTTTGGTAVPLGPLGAFSRDEPVSLYWQVRSAAARDPVRITIALYRAGPRDSEQPVLEVAFDGRLQAGLNELQRNLGVAELDGGTYRVEVTVRDGEASASRSVQLLLK